MQTHRTYSGYKQEDYDRVDTESLQTSLDIIIIACTLASYTKMSDKLPNFVNNYQLIFSLYSILAIQELIGKNFRMSIRFLICILFAIVVKAFTIKINERNTFEYDISIRLK